MLSIPSRRGFLALLSLLFLPVPRNVFAQQPPAPLPSAGRPDAATGPRVVNTLPEYLAFWDEAGSKDEATQIRLFRQNVLEAHPELFTDNIVDFGQKKGVEEENRRIGNYLKQFRPLVPAIRILNGRLQQDLATYVQGFVQVFPDYHPSSTVYFTVSLGQFDGATRTVDGHPALLFGVDVIARLYGPSAKLSVLFDHELFHQYHESLDLPHADPEGQLWESLWEEGLATYVSWRMNPSADENDVLLSKTLAGRARPLLPALAQGMLESLRATDSKSYDKYFVSNSDDKTIPPRSGYFVGFLVASQLGQSSTPFALAHLSGTELRTQVEQTLRLLARSAQQTQ